MTWRLAGRLADERYRCVAPCRRSGERCRNPAIQGTTLCRKHGGTRFERAVAGARERLEKRVLEYIHEYMQ